MTRLGLAAALFAALITLGPREAHAHPLQFGVLEVNEQRGGQGSVVFHISGAEARTVHPTVKLTPSCPIRDHRAWQLSGSDDAWQAWTYDCGPKGLDGRQLNVTGLEGTDVSVLLHVTRLNGTEQRALSTNANEGLTISAATGLLDTLSRYTELGIEHIATGTDHLLFVLALFLLCATRRVLVATITSFTVGHSVTLALAALNVVNPPSAPIEACIALSVVLVWAEVARAAARRSDANPQRSLAEARPWLVAGTFGLLHGLGFAGALKETGLPHNDRVAALFAFNVGVELGQLVFVGLAGGVAWLLATTARRAIPNRGHLQGHAVRLLAYVAGTTAAFWTLGRLALI